MILNLKRIFIFLSEIALIWGVAFTSFATSLITDYQPIFVPCFVLPHQLEIAIRYYHQGNQFNYLVVNPYTLKTQILAVSRCYSRLPKTTTPGYFSFQTLAKTPYFKALKTYDKPTSKLQNQGFTHAKLGPHQMILTIDLCPSVKPFEKSFFKKLIQKKFKPHHPVFVTLSITGLWLLQHPHEFNWLIQQQKHHILNITWMNHSYSHLYYPDLPLDKNFLLAERTHIPFEHLETEKLLLMHHQIPSVFFRAPGLITDTKLMNQLSNWGLILVGSDAWLAKGQQPQRGSVILIHGNGNEPQGIHRMSQLLAQNSTVLFAPLIQHFENETP